MGTRRPLLILTLAILTAASARPARAQGTDALMQRLAALEAHHPAAVPEGALTSIRYELEQASRMRDEHEPESDAWRARADHYLTRAEAGADPFAEAKGEITVRAYQSRISPALQNYGVYVPPDYDPSRAYPVYIALHGGSSNGNLFLGVLLGNNMDWLTYPEHLYDVYTPQWSPEWIVVAPTGFGQVMWRWMGEQDLLDVLADVERHYHVDEDRVVLGGLSNGGVGAYAVGARHASRFSVVQAMSGAPSWLQYLGRTRPEVERSVRPWSAMDLAKNLTNTHFRYYHGLRDGGPMRPDYVRAFEAHLDELGMDNHATWYDTGHDILYYVHRHGRIYAQLAEERRDPRPHDVLLVSGDYRAAEQHWLRLTHIQSYPDLANVHGRVEGAQLSLETHGAGALRVDLSRCPLEGDPVRVVADGQEVYAGPRAALGQALHLVRRGDEWQRGFPDARAREKRPELSGPITDAYFDAMIHVYGTANAEHTDALRDAAQRGARGWPLWAWDLKQQVVADSEVTPEMMRSATIVLYGSPGDNTLLTRMDGALPIHVDAHGVGIGDRRFDGDDVGVRFLYPNPLAPERYVVVQAAVTPEQVGAANKLAEFGGDWVVFDARTLRGAQRRVFGPNRPLDVGYFDDLWRLPGTATPSEGAGPDDGSPLASSLPIPEAPPVPHAPREFLAPAGDQAGDAARAIWQLIPHFENFRALVPGAVWRVRRQASFPIRPSEACLEDLRQQGVLMRPSPPQSALVPTPVELLGPIEGVWLRSMHPERPLVISCELAARLPALMRVLKERGVLGVDILSAYRDHPRTSFHTMGLGLDLARFWTSTGWLSVLDDYAATPDQGTCTGPAPSGAKARRLRAIACAISRSDLFSSVLTPNYNEGHRDHLHLDARPDDPRLFLR